MLQAIYRKSAKIGVFILLLSVSSFALGQDFEGTWDTDFGDVRLKTAGFFVYGDYANRGVIEGFSYQDPMGGDFLRARFERTDGYVGYVEWYIKDYEGEGNPNGLRGRWVERDTNGTYPDADWRSDIAIGSRWNGEQSSTSEPTLTAYQGDEVVGLFVRDHGSETVNGTSFSDWIMFRDKRDTPMMGQTPWMGTWDTPHGEIRLNQVGGATGPVYGDYGSVGSIRGTSRLVEGKYILRARFDRDDGSKGYIEWASDGKADDTITGRWTWDRQSFPTWNGTDGGDWTSIRTSAATPTITKVAGNIHDRGTLTRGDSQFANWIFHIEPKQPLKVKRNWKAPNKFEVPFRDVGVIIHHTRFPFLTTPQKFQAHIHSDKNFSLNVVGGSGKFLDSPLRLATSPGDVFDEKSGRKMPADVIMGVYEHQTQQDESRSYCVISYRGTDQDVDYFGDGYRITGDTEKDDAFGVLGEGGIAMEMTATDLDPSSNLCVVKDGYKKNYEETKSSVIDFLNDATAAGHCESGILITGMSLGGATASVAATDFALTQKRILNDGPVKSLIGANKVTLVTAGAPRALSKQCVDRLPASTKKNSLRFVYGSTVMEAKANIRNESCPRFIDPVPGNPVSMRVGARPYLAQHFGKPIVGFVPNIGGYDPRIFLNELAKKPIRAGAAKPDEALCTSDPLNRCLSARWANNHSRVAAQKPQIYPVSDKNFGGECLGANLIPPRKYLFGRLHDTCSYRNLMAAYGGVNGQFANATNYQCPFPSNPSDPVDGPKSFTSWGFTIEQKQRGPR